MKYAYAYFGLTAKWQTVTATPTLKLIRPLHILT